MFFFRFWHQQKTTEQEDGYKNHLLVTHKLFPKKSFFKPKQKKNLYFMNFQSTDRPSLHRPNQACMMIERMELLF